jgi:hypothetical protein
MGYIYEAAERAARKHDTRNPYELLESIGANIRYCHEFEPDGLRVFDNPQQDNVCRYKRQLKRTRQTDSCRTRGGSLDTP